MRIKCLVIMIIALVVQQFEYCCTAQTDIVKSYYLLKYEYKEFVNPLLYAGVTEEEIIAFLGDVENYLGKIDNISKDNFDGYFKQAIRSAATKDSNFNVTGALLSVYGDALDEYTNTGQIPQKLQGVYDALIEVLFGDGFVNKEALVSAFEEYKAILNSETSNYTAASLKDLEVALTEAEYVLGDSSASDSEIEDALAKMKSAYNALVKVSGGSGGSSDLSGAGGGSSSGSSHGSGKVPSSGSSVGIGQSGENIPVAHIEFKDLSAEHWSYNAVNALAEKGVIAGFEDNTFRPDELVTREQFAKLICVAFDLKSTSDGMVFTDAAPNAWYNEYIRAIVSNNIMNGMGNSQFGIGLTLSRQDLAVIVYRMINNGITNREYKEQSDAEQFVDIDEAAGYAVEAITSIKRLGIINGVGGGRYAPRKGVTRAEAAKIIYSLLSI